MGDKKHEGEEKKYEGTGMVVDYYLKNNQTNAAIQFAKDLPEIEATTQCLIKILDFFLKEEGLGKYTQETFKIVGFLGEDTGKERLELILRIVVSKGMFYESQMVADFLGQKLSRDDLKTILSILLSEKNTEMAEEVAKLLDEM